MNLYDTTTIAEVLVFLWLLIDWSKKRTRRYAYLLLCCSVLLVSRAWGYARGSLALPTTVDLAVNAFFIVVTTASVVGFLYLLFAKEKNNNSK